MTHKTFKEVCRELENNPKDWYLLNINSFIMAAIPMNIIKGNQPVSYYIPAYLYHPIKDLKLEDSFNDLAASLYGDVVTLPEPISLNDLVILNSYTESYWLLGSYPTILEGSCISQYLPF